MTPESPQSMAVLAEPYLTGYQVDSLVHAVEETDIDIPLVIVNDNSRSGYDSEQVAAAVNNSISVSTLRLFADVFERESWWSFVIAERKIAEELGLSDTAERRIHIDDVSVFDDAEVRYVEPNQNGSWNSLPEETIAEVATRVDLVVRYGFGLIEGDILTAPRDGVLSFHPADIREYRGLGPPQAYVDGRSTVGLTLQRLSEGIDDGEIVAIEQQDVSDCRTLWDIYDRLRAVQRRLLATSIQNLRDPEFEPLRPDSLGEYYSITARREPGFTFQVLGMNAMGYLTRMRSELRAEATSDSTHNG